MPADGRLAMPNNAGVPTLNLRVPPEGRDRYGRLSWHVAQTRGLVEHQGDRLMRAAQGSGYLARVDDAIFEATRRIVRGLAGSTRVDVVELGGGDGHLYDRLVEVTRSYVNIEPGEIELGPTGLRRLADPRYSSLRCSAVELPLADEVADVVVSIASIDHIPAPDRALDEAWRCLRPGGHVIVTLNNRHSWWKAVLAGSRLLSAREHEMRNEHFIIWSLDECMDHIGRRFSIERADSLIFAPFVPIIWRVMLPVADVIGPLVLPRMGAHSVVVGRKPLDRSVCVSAR